jgi:O-antigen/teichoic acid export membrane protein
MASEHYSLDKAKRSLTHFGAGKLVSALAGVITLLLMVRVLPSEDYGWFVTLIALVEIFYLLTGLGLSTVVQRYVADFRIQASHRRFKEFIIRILSWRLLSALGGAAIVLVLTDTLLHNLGMADAKFGVAPFMMLLCIGALLRFMDEIFPALLLQGHAQLSVLLRNAIKALSYIVPWWLGLTVTLTEAVMIELAATSVALLVAFVVMMRYLARTRSDGSDTYMPEGMWSVSTRFYLVQIIGQIYGTNALKLLVMRTLGPEATGALGFAQSIVDMIRNYLPAHLLAGWVRPLMISRYVQSKNAQDVAQISWMIFKLNLFGIIPLAVFFALLGDEFGALASGGRFQSSGFLFFWLTVLLLFQTAHVLVSLLTITIERPAANILATFVACVGLPLAWLLAPSAGVEGVVLSLIVAEMIWVGIVIVSLAKGHVVSGLNTSGFVPMLLAGFALWLAGVCFPELPALPTVITIVLGAGVIVTLYLFLLAFIKPLLPRERQLLVKFIPARLLFW